MVYAYKIIKNMTEKKNKKNNDWTEECLLCEPKSAIESLTDFVIKCIAMDFHSVKWLCNDMRKSKQIYWLLKVSF